MVEGFYYNSKDNFSNDVDLIIALSISIAHFHCFHWTKRLTRDKQLTVYF